jgi:hypothetical protein
MSFRFQADADVDPDIARGIRRREPAIDFQGAAGVIPDGAPDFEVLGIAASHGRVLVTRDVTTMPACFDEFTIQRVSPAVLLIPSRWPIGEVIEGILVVWLNWPEDALKNQIRWLPRARRRALQRGIRGLRSRKAPANRPRHPY